MQLQLRRHTFGLILEAWRGGNMKTEVMLTHAAILNTGCDFVEWELRENEENPNRSNQASS